MFAVKSLVLILLICSQPIDSFAKSYLGQNESFILYFSAGPSIPVGDAAKELQLGYKLSGGFGVLLSSSNSISSKSITSELNIKFGFNCFELKNHKAHVTNGYVISTTNYNLSYLSLEGRFRLENYRRLRPYLTFGFGFAGGTDSLVPDLAHP